MLGSIHRRLLVQRFLAQIPQLPQVILHLAHRPQHLPTVMGGGFFELGVGLALIGAQPAAVKNRQVHQRPQGPITIARGQQVAHALGLATEHAGQAEIRVPGGAGDADAGIGGIHTAFGGGNVRPSLQQGAGQLPGNARQAQELRRGRQVELAGRLAHQFADGVFGEVALGAHFVQFGFGAGQLARRARVRSSSEAICPW